MASVKDGHGWVVVFISFYFMLWPRCRGRVWMSAKFFWTCNSFDNKTDGNTNNFRVLIILAPRVSHYYSRGLGYFGCSSKRSFVRVRSSAARRLPHRSAYGLRWTETSTRVRGKKRFDLHVKLAFKSPKFPNRNANKTMTDRRQER